MINLNQLRAFYYVAKNLSFTKAAQELFISQPAVTSQVKLFENYYDLKFFKRIKNKLYLTNEGQEIFEAAEFIYKKEDMIEQTLLEMKELKKGILKLGSTKAYTKYIMPSIISSFHRIYPKIQIKLDEGNSMDMVNSLLNFKNEVVVVAAIGPKNPSVKYLPFSQEEIIIIFAPDHPLAAKKTIKFDEISKEPIILKGSGSGTRQRINQLYKKNQCKPNIYMETNNTDFIIDLVHRGEAISFLVKASVTKQIETKQLASTKLKDQKILLNVNFAYLKNSPLSPAAHAFYEFVKQSYMIDTPKGGVGSLMARILAEHRQNY